MIKILTQLFSSHNYEKISVPNVEYATFFLSKGQNSNFIVLETTHLEVCTDEFIESIIINLKKTDKWSINHLKNTLFLILFDSTDEENQSSLIHRCQNVEENKYAFKRLVLDYNRSQLEELYSVFKGNDFSIQNLNTHLNNRENFKKFSSEKSLTSSYDLLLKIFVKIPFLNLITDSNNFINLQETISGLVSENLNSLQLILAEFSDIESLDDEEIAKILSRETNQ